MELKVVCDCGQKYKFDVVPVNGQMPFTVNCPACGVDGTPAANQLLGQHLASVPAPPPLPPLDPAPIAPGGLRINRPAPAAAPPPPLFATSATPRPVPGSTPAPTKPMMKAPVAAPKDFSMGLGVLGAFLGSAVGGALVYGFFLFAHFRFPLSGTAIGILSGCGAKMLARGTDATLGFIAGGLALASIVCVFYLMFLASGFFSIFWVISIVICIGFAYRIASG